MKKATVNIIIKWISGAFLSFVIICIIGRFFKDSMEPNAWVEEITKSVPVENFIHRHRSEGWANSAIGKYGINGIPDIKEIDKPKIFIWGDSYVQAKQVSDKNKIAAQFTESWKKKKSEHLIGVGIGFGGCNVSDYYYLIPKYEALTDNIRCHFIVIHSFHDLLPSKNTNKIGGVFSQNKYGFALKNNQKKPNPIMQKFVKIGYVTGMNFFNQLYYDYKDKQLNFNVGEFHRPVIPASRNKVDIDIYHPAWNFLLSKLQQCTDKKIVFIYIPTIPCIANGKVTFVDTNKQLLTLFNDVCIKYNIDLIDCTDDFTALYVNEKLFPRGFANSLPYAGHLNSHGNKIVSNTIIKYLNSTQKKLNKASSVIQSN